MLSEQERKDNIEDIDAILANEGFDPAKAPEWYKDLKQKYIAGEISSEQITAEVLTHLSEAKIIND